MSTALDELPALLTPPELARLLRTTPNSLAQDRYLGRGVPFVRHGRKVLYARTDVVAYLEGNRCHRTDDPRGAGVA
jgi:Helix-turn-helix domain